MDVPIEVQRAYLESLGWGGCLNKHCERRNPWRTYPIGARGELLSGSAIALFYGPSYVNSRILIARIWGEG